jgi:hypothetical protein
MYVSIKTTNAFDKAIGNWDKEVVHPKIKNDIFLHNKANVLLITQTNCHLILQI